MRFLRDVNINSGSKVFVRCDLDVPLKEGKISDTFRLDAAIPTLTYLLEHKACVTIAGHIGRPEGYNALLSTSQLRPYFEEKLKTSDFTLLENLRFDSREEENEPEFAKELAQGIDLYVNDCFATSHREHTSIVGIPKLVPAYAGLNLEKEVASLEKVLINPARPLVAIVGGAKLETKKPAVSKFLNICESVLVGGRIALDWDLPAEEKLILASDFVSETRDIGPRSIGRFCDVVLRAATIVWSGPLGLFEEGFITGTKSVAEAVVSSKAFSIVGGGDTVAALKELNMLNRFSFVSTGGGAMLEFLIKGTLLGLEVLN